MALDRRTEAFETKEWTSRISEYPNRRDLMDAETNTLFKTVNVVRNEGDIQNPGDGFTKTNMNGLEERINEAFIAEHTFLEATLAKNGTYVMFHHVTLIDTGIIPHIFVPMAHNKLIPESYVLDAVNHNLRVNFDESYTSAQTFPDGGITIKLKVEYDLTPQPQS